MAQPDAFAMSRSDLNGFLFADIGVELSGMPLSVASALARQGFDPWQEAGRLAKLPRAVAADVLASLIAAMPAGLWPISAATPIAARLVALLPDRNSSPSLETIGRDGSWKWMVAVAFAVTLLAAAVANLDVAPDQAKVSAAAVSPPTGQMQPATTH